MLSSLTAMKFIEANLEKVLIVSAILGRFLLTTTSALGVATAANWANHKSYWEGTIFRVQTTDFNILSHTLPTKLSYALQKRDYVELQRTLDSNYGLFGMVITNCKTIDIECSNQKILYVTESTSRWRQQLKIQDLPQYPYDLLRDPPPLVTEGGFENSRDQTWNSANKGDTGKNNRGEIIGRVYYIRGIPPEFLGDYSDWFKELPTSLLSDRGAHRYYSLTVSLFLSSGLVAWGFIEWISSQKRLQKRLAQQEEQRLLREAQKLRNQVVKQLQRQEYLLSELQYYRGEQESLSDSLAQRISSYEDELKQKELDQQHNIQNLKRLDQELQEIQKRQVEGQEQLQRREQAIINLQDQIAAQQREKQQTDQGLKQLQQNLQITQQKLISTSSRVQNLDASIASLTQERDLATRQVQQLEYELQNIRSTQTAKVTALTEALKAAKDLENYVVQENEKLSQENEKLSNKLIQLKYANKNLEDECLQCQTQVQYLEEQLELFQTRRPDLSSFTLALVGGHPDMRRYVLHKLQSEYGLQSTNAIEIPPPPERSFNERQLRSKIGNCTLVVILTYCCSHPLRNMVISLERSNALIGKVLELPANCRGKNSVFESINRYIIKHPELLST